MVSSRVLYGLSAVVALVNGQAVIQKAVGDRGESKSLFLKANDPNDANIIKQAEIVTNIVNECGRTLSGGNIDIGEQTEIALAAKEITQSKKGGKVTVTLNQKNAQGSGPFTCDMDLTGNSNAAVGQTPLKVTQNRAQFGTGVMTFEVEMPADMACIGASTGNICTVRCRNAQEFGGCFAVQQTDTRANANKPNNIITAATLDQALKQTLQAQKDFEPAVGAIAGSSLDNQGTAVADALIANNKAVLAGGNNNNNNGGGAGAGAGAGNGGNNNNNGGAGRGGNNNAGNGAGRGNAGGNGNANAGNGAGRGNAGGNGNANAGNGAGRGNGNANAGNGAGRGNAGNGAARGGNANAGNGAARGGNANAGANNNNANQKRYVRAVRSFRA